MPPGGFGFFGIGSGTAVAGADTPGMSPEPRKPVPPVAASARCRTLVLLAAVCVASCAWTARSPAAENRLRIVERAVNLDGDRLHEGLELECFVVLEQPGRWDVAVTLTGEHACSAWMPGTALALTRANFLGDWMRRPDGYRFPSIETDAHGRAHFVAYFKGEDLARFSSEGPWKLCLVADRAPHLQSAGAGGSRPSLPLRVELETDTRAWSRARFDLPDPEERGRARAFDGVARGEDLVFAEGLDLIAVTVTKVDTGGTRRRPPRIEVRVDEVLKGKVEQGPLEVFWAAEPDTAAADTPYPAPALGSRWILGGDRRFTKVWVSFARARWRYSRLQLAHLEDVVRDGQGQAVEATRPE